MPVRSEVLGQFVNIFTSDYKNSRWNLENLPQLFQMLTCLEPKFFSAFFIAFMKSTLNFENFAEKVSLKL